MKTPTVARLSRWIAGLLILAAFLCGSASRLGTEQMGLASQALWTASGQIDDLSATYRSWAIRDMKLTLSQDHAAQLGHETSAVTSELATIDHEGLPGAASDFVASALQGLTYLGMAETSITYRMVGNGLRQASYDLQRAQDKVSAAARSSNGDGTASPERSGAANMMGSGGWILVATLATLAVAVSTLAWVSVRSDRRNGIEARTAAAPDGRLAAVQQRLELDEMLARIANQSPSRRPPFNRLPTT